MRLAISRFPLLLLLGVTAGLNAADARFQGRTAAEWAQALGSPEGMTAMDALQSGDKAALPVLVELLKSPHSAVRVTAAGGLAELGPGAEAALPGVILAIKDKNLNVRYYALSTARNLGPAAASAVPALIEALSTHPDREPGLEGPPRYYKDARWVAADALGRVGPAAKAAIPRLQELARKDESSEVRDAATKALALIGKK